MSVYVIAEAGSCHENSLTTALAMVGIAHAAGADAIKFQFWSSADRLAARRNAPAYRDVYAAYQMPLDWLRPLREAAIGFGIDLLCTTYLPEDVHLVAPLVDKLKVASFEAADRAFLALHRRFEVPVILSTGMMSLEEAVVEAILLQPWAVLHCVSSYPCPNAMATVGMMPSLRVALAAAVEPEPKVGYSDHTTSTLTGAVATGAGAEVLEKHLRVAATTPGNPDYATALDAHQFADYVTLVREASVLLGSGREKRSTAIEDAMRPYRVTHRGVA